MTLTHTEQAFNIVLAGAGDLSELVALRRLAILEDAPSAMPQKQVVLWAEKNKTTDIKAQITCHEIWLVRSVAGCLLGWVRTKKNRIEALYVSKHYMGNGIGRSLLTFAENTLINNGFHIAYLEASLNAIPFYLRCGYTESPIQKSTDFRNMEKMINHLDGNNRLLLIDPLQNGER